MSEEHKRLKMADLAQEFCVAGVPGFYPWRIGEDDEPDLDEAVKEAFGCSSGGEQEAIRFVLSVWNRELPEFYELGPFNVHDALMRWDTSKRKAFAKWACNPWWC